MNRIILLEGLPGTGKTTNSCCREAGFGIPIRPEACKTCHLAGCIAWEEFAMGAVCRADNPHTIMGWCGLDGSRNPAEPEIFILLDEPYRGKGYGTLCIKEMLRIAAEDYALPGVHGGCVKENIVSARAMEKGGMVQYGTEENGDPLFRFCANNESCQEGNTCG